MRICSNGKLTSTRHTVFPTLNTPYKNRVGQTDGDEQSDRGEAGRNPADSERIADFRRALTGLAAQFPYKNGAAGDEVSNIIKVEEKGEAYWRSSLLKSITKFAWRKANSIFCSGRI